MCMREYACVKYEVENRIAKITMNLPQKLNALDAKLASEIVVAMGEANHDDSVKVVVITGSSRAFCAGGDVRFSLHWIWQGVSSSLSTSNLWWVHFRICKNLLSPL